MLDRARHAGLLQGAEVIISDKGFAGQEFEQLVSSLDATLARPDRKHEPPRFGKLGGVRQWIESIINTTKSQLSLELHGGHIPAGVWTRICHASWLSPSASGTAGSSGKPESSKRPAATSPTTTTEPAKTESGI
jgi:hypothetical protein